MDLKKNWSRELAKALFSIEQLATYQLISSEHTELLKEVKKQFNINVPTIFLPKILSGHQSLARQVIPTKNELVFFPEELDDPIGDEPYSPIEGLTHRYPDRVLFKPTYLCGVYCRFCFRRYKVSKEKSNLTLEQENLALKYIKDHPQIWEVILTGGDPLILTDKKIAEILTKISSIEHVKIIRIHTRIPSVLPSRINLSLLEIFNRIQKKIWIAVHINSAEEFTSECCKALEDLARIGIPLLLQSVLLKGVNDSEEQLIKLFRTATENGVKPYYLHYPDLAKGTAHFRIPLEEAILLLSRLHGKISGLCLPKLMVDIPNGKGKIAVHSGKAWRISRNIWEFESPIDQSRYTVIYPED